MTPPQDAAQRAEEIVRVVLAACDEHGPIAPAYAERLVRPIVDAAVAEATKERDARLAAVENDYHAMRGKWCGEMTRRENAEARLAEARELIATKIRSMESVASPFYVTDLMDIEARLRDQEATG